MKSIFNKHWFGVPILVFVLVVALGIGGIVWAATGQVTPVTHSATGVAAPPPPPPPPPPPTYTFALYEVDGTTPLVLPIAWGNITVGGPVVNKTVVAKNTGTGTFSVGVDTSAVPAGWTLVAGTASNLAPGAYGNIVLSLSTSVAGPVSFSTDFKATY